MTVEHDTVAELCKGLIENRLSTSKRHSNAVNAYLTLLVIPVVYYAYHYRKAGMT